MKAAAPRLTPAPRPSACESSRTMQPFAGRGKTVCGDAMARSSVTPARDTTVSAERATLSERSPAAQLTGGASIGTPGMPGSTGGPKVVVQLPGPAIASTHAALGEARVSGHHLSQQEPSIARAAGRPSWAATGRLEAHPPTNGSVTTSTNGQERHQAWRRRLVATHLVGARSARFSQSGRLRAGTRFRRGRRAGRSGAVGDEVSACTGVSELGFDCGCDRARRELQS